MRCVIGSVASMGNEFSPKFLLYSPVDVYSDEFADAAKNIQISTSDLFPDNTPYAPGISLKLWNLVIDSVWSNVLDATQTAVQQIADLNLSEKVTFVEDFADSILGKFSIYTYITKIYF